MIPVYEKPYTSGKPRRKPGARNGHPGSRRKTPPRVDARVEHRLSVCPCCAGQLQRCQCTRKRTIEVLPESVTPVVTEQTIHHDYCPNCKKHAEPVVPDALPNATRGHHLIALTSWFHYGFGTTPGQLQDTLACHLHTQVTPGGLLDGWRRLAEILTPWYEQMAIDTRSGSVLQADETGWRVDGTTHWLWWLPNKENGYYLIDRSRGSPAFARFFTEAFDGTLVTDFWAAYESVAAWQAFARQLRRLVRDGIRLRKRPDLTPGRYRSRLHLIHRRLVNLADAPRSADDDMNRLTERLSKHRDDLFTLLDKPEVPFENSSAKRLAAATTLFTMFVGTDGRSRS